jgi:two-component system, OmpR family, phosphate regulon response regulator PhoB
MMEPKRVLVVDDELDMRIFLSTVFETAGYRAVSARDGRDGFAKAAESPPDLIVLDLMMPGEGGVRMYRQLKEDVRLREVPVFILSGVDRATFYHYLKMLNVRPEESIPEPDAYLEKPPTPESVLDIAGRLLGAPVSGAS